MKQVSSIVFKRIMYIPIINILTVFLTMWNIIASKEGFLSKYKSMLKCALIMAVSVFTVNMIVSLIILVFPMLSQYAIIAMAYFCPLLFVMGVLRYHYLW